jgi:hypothetical protein
MIKRIEKYLNDIKTDPVYDLVKFISGLMVLLVISYLERTIEWLMIPTLGLFFSITNL